MNAVFLTIIGHQISDYEGSNAPLIQDWSTCNPRLSFCYSKIIAIDPQKVIEKMKYAVFNIAEGKPIFHVLFCYILLLTSAFICVNYFKIAQPFFWQQKTVKYK